MPPTPGQLHIDRWLTNLSIEFQQTADDFIAPKVFPIVPVDKQSDRYVVFDREAFWRDNFPERPLGGSADVAEWTLSDDTYFCVERALAQKYDDRQKFNADDPIELGRTATSFLTQRAMVNMDRRFVQNYFGTGIWATDWTGVSSGPSTNQFLQFDQDGSDPVRVIDDARTAIHSTTAMYPNKMIVGERAHRTIKNHPEILDRIKYTQRGMLTNDLLAAMFEVDDYVVARSIYNEGAEGLDPNYSYIADDDGILLLHAATRPGLYTPSAGYVFAWNSLLGGSTSPQGTAIQRGRDEFAHSDHFEIRVANDMKMVAEDLGLYLDAVVGAA